VKINIAFFLIAVASATAFAQTTVGLKDVYSSKFKFGNILNGSTVNNNAMKTLVLREFNSITPENELKPEKTIVQSGSTDDNVKVSLSNAASILKFCEDNNIPVRGHTLVWHSQTPTWFFKTGFTDNGTVVSKAVMKKRMESYIKNMFALITTSYPKLNLYAYDVVNEAAKESGSGPREPGSGSGQSMWVQVYGDNSFIEEAFTFARQYAPKTTKLFYNDFNEYMSAKRDYIANSIIKPLKEKGLIDGMGMQSHLDVRSGGNNVYPSASDYGAAITTYKNLGVEIHVSELDATVNDGNESYFPAQATYYKDIMNQILTKGGSAITAVVVWGIQDDQSWRKAKKPLLFDASGNKKAAYNELVKLIPESDWGKTGSSSSVAVSSSSSKASSSSAAASSSSRASSSSVRSSSSVVSSSSRVSSSSSAISSSSSAAVSSSSNITESSSSSEEALSSSSSEEDITPILGSGLSTQDSQLITYYSLKGEPLGSAKPQKAGIYIVKQGYSVKKIVVR
jgi:GH35 family endo-1,4-beta-xylanase